MSWTVTSKYEHIIRSAIEEAAEKDILMFGAASDQGYNAATKVYPAEYDQVFCIGAAKATGRADAAAELQANYVFPGGEWSDLRAPRGGSDNTLEHAWGSSFSTALASGLAALILDCSEILSVISPGKQYRGAIRKKDKLDKIFSSMIREKGSKYIPVTQFFTPEIASAVWDSEGKQKFKKAIKNIIRYVLIYIIVNKSLADCFILDLFLNKLQKYFFLCCFILLLSTGCTGRIIGNVK